MLLSIIASRIVNLRWKMSFRRDTFSFFLFSYPFFIPLLPCSGLYIFITKMLICSKSERAYVSSQQHNQKKLFFWFSAIFKLMVAEIFRLCFATTSRKSFIFLLQFCHQTTNLVFLKLQNSAIWLGKCLYTQHTYAICLYNIVIFVFFHSPSKLLSQFPQ